jgi:hypothetical protein
MDDDPKRQRNKAEARFDALKSTDEAKSIIDSDLEAARKKTERLRKLRLAKEAGAEITEIDKKPTPKKPRRRRSGLRRG